MTFSFRTASLLAALASATLSHAQEKHPATELGPAPLRRATTARSGVPRTTPPPAGFVVDTANREEVRTFYNAVFAATDGKEIGWTGNATTGVAGTTSSTFREAVRVRINCFRALAGLPAGITFSDTLHPKCQQAALMMSANGALSHEPPAAWTFYTADGADAAANANLSLGDFGADAITGYMEDPGANNAEVGHRRWLLYPQTQVMATGDVPASGSGQTLRSGANAVWVFDSHFSESRPTVRDDFVAWPPPGYVPHPLVYPRWSFSYPGADFSTTSVTLTKNGANLPVTKEPIHSGYGEETLVWIPQGQNPNDWQPGTAPAADQTFVVTLTGVKIGAQTQNFTYTVRSFDPARPGNDTVEANVSGPQFVTIGETAQFSCAAVPRATAYDWEFAEVAASPAAEGAESGTSGIIPHVSGYNIVSNTAASGSHSFHLTTIDPSPQWFELATTLLPRTGATMTFKSRIGYSGTGQTARVQFSRDEGLTWNDVFTHTGDNGEGETAFVNRSIALTGYEGRSLRVRFRYDYRAGGDGYFESADDVGWLIDNIDFTSTDSIGAKSSQRTTSISQRNPASTGAFLVRVRPVFFSSFPGEWAPVFRLTVAPPASLLQINVTPPDGGSVTPGFAGTTQRTAGSSLKVQAFPASGFLFNGWTGGITSAEPLLSFSMPSGLTLTANFVLNEFALGAGNYFGLLAAVPSAHSQAGTYSIKVSASGSFSGKVLIGGKTTRFTGKLTPTGSARFGSSAAESLATPLPFKFNIALASGTISATLDGTALIGSRRTGAAPTGDWIGAYTSRISATSPASGAWPEGDGWAHMSISSSSTVTLAGALADGTKVSAGGWLGNDGRWSVYIPLYGGKGSLSGIASLANLPTSDINAPLRWFRPPGSAARFSAGWPAGLDCTLSGAHYTPPGPTERILPALDPSGAATISADSASSAVSLSWPVSVDSGTQRITLTPASMDRSLRASFNAKTGTFSATFKNPESGRTYRGKGVVIQKEQVATGFALGPAASVRVRLAP